VIRKRLLGYILKKALSYAIVLYVSFTIVFFLLRLIPGNPIRIYVDMLRMNYGFNPYSEQVIRKWEEEYGLNQDVFTQYIIFIKRLLSRGSLGPSFLAFPRPVEVLIFRSLPWSIGLLGMSAIIAWILGIIAGVLVGWKRGSKFDSVMFSISLVLSQIPYYLLAISLLLLFAYALPIFPPRGGYSPSVSSSIDLNFLLSVAYHAFLPATSLVAISACGWLISTRALTISILGEDYLILAEAKGLKKSRILIRYVLRNILLPQTTNLALSLGYIVSGSFLVEWIFVYPGIGTLFVNAIRFHDFNIIQGIILLTMFSVLTANLIMDIIYPLIDPRIVYEGGR